MRFLTSNYKSNTFVSTLKYLNVRHTSRYSNKLFRGHPHRNNLLGLSAMFSDYNIDNVAIRVNDKASDIFKLETPFIAHLGNSFVLVHKVLQDNIYYYWSGRDIELKVDKFLRSWTGIVLLTESNEDSIEPDFKEHHKEELINAVQKILLIISVGLLLFLSGVNNQSFTSNKSLLLMSINLIGVYFGYLLVQKQMHIHSSYADKICSLFSQNDCNDVLESSGAKLWGMIGWSEIGLGYFVSNILLMIYIPQLISYLAIISIITLPYSFWSVWYQKSKVGQWCPLCLLVQVLLWTIFCVNLIFGFEHISLVKFHYVLTIVFTYVLSILSLNIIIPRLAKSARVEDLEQIVSHIKADEQVFMTLLKKQSYFEPNREISNIIWGDPNAKLKVTILTNPHCDPCARMHERVEKLLNHSKNNISIQYIFSSFNENLDSSNKFLLSVYLNNDKQTSARIFKEWFAKGRYRKEEFFNHYKSDIVSDAKVIIEFEKHERWKERTGIRATPTILIGGYELPDNYKIEDLIYFTKLEL